MGTEYGRERSGCRRTRLHFVILLLLWNTTSAQIRYSIQEELKIGTIVGNIAKDLGIDRGTLSERNLRIVTGSKQDLFQVNERDGALFVNQRIDREELCGKSSPCHVNLKAVIENPLEMHHVTVEIVDVNDHSPNFPDREYRLEVSESTMTGVRFELEGASDPDIGMNTLRQYKLSQNDKFHLEVEDLSKDGKTPFLILKNQLDREQIPQYYLLLTAVDGGSPPRSGAANITVIVLDINDHTPVCDQQKYSLTVRENVAVDTFLLRVSASDLDEGMNGAVEYSFRSKQKSKASEIFHLDKITGEIKIIGPIDFEEEQMYELKIQASDKGHVPLSTHCNVFVKVEDVNDNKPEIDVTSLSSRIRENAPPGTVVALMGVTDLDSGVNGQVVCTLAGDLPFDLKPSSEGNFYSLVTKSPLDRESVSQYDVTVTAKDLGSPSLSSSKTIRVEISDINDNSPLFSESPYTLYLVENNAPGASIFTVSASDADEGENALVSYSLGQVSAGHSAASFLNINPDNGNIYALKSFDFETLKTFQFQVVAKDSGTPSLSSNVTVNVFILDQNDNAPVILSPVSANGSAEGVEEIPRNVNAGHSVAKVRAFDADIGYNAWLSFSLQHATDASLFSLERYTGQIRTLRSFTETDEAEQRLVIVVKDNGNVSLSATATVSIKAVEPKEAFAASDAKSAVQTEEENNVTFYLMITLSSVSALFLLSIIGLIVMQCSKPPDYSPKYSRDSNYADTSGNGTLCHSIQYRSGDKRYMLVGPRMSIGSAIVPGSHANTLMVPDHRNRTSGEVCSELFCFLFFAFNWFEFYDVNAIRYSIQEELKIGTIVGNIAKDVGIDRGTLSDRNLRIVTGSKQDLFQVNERDGALFVNQRIDREELCGKSSPCHVNLKAVIENPLEMHHVTVEIVDVNDHSPSFPSKESRLEISESAMPGARFQLESARDPDVDLDAGANGEVTYAFGKEFSSHMSELFDLDSKSGEIKVKGLVNFEDEQIYEITIQASDKGQVPLSTHCNVFVKVEDVNDNKPEIDVTSLSSRIRENAPPGTVVALMGVTDLDSGVNGQVVCTLAGDLPFDLKPSSEGNFYSLVTKSPLDRESVSQYDITVTAKDLGSPSLSSSKTIRVEISDINDNSPVFSESPYTLYLVENNAPGASMFTVSASDADEGENALVSYSLGQVSAGHSAASFLNINPDNGNIYALKSFDFETLKTFQFQVVAKDSGTPSLSSNVTVNVFILDQNDNAPVILSPVSANGSAEGVEEIPRNVNAGHSVAKVRAFDADIGYNAWLSFSLQHATDASLFSLERYTGQIRTLRSFTETDEAEQRLVIVVKDNGNVSLSATATVSIKAVEPKEAFAASDTKSAVQTEEENNVTFYLIITLSSVSALFLLSIIGLIVMQCSKPPDYSPKYSRDSNYADTSGNGTLCHSIQCSYLERLKWLYS
ncbi:protocadherin alpha-6-like [Conger conger]|uniref:protocadherin alpha-6-like n=1 Tax=Conger conger TaxID=82655 RepID=UPI002A5ABB1D|nr:protocadherin alpha-6-like [Conger conger]